MALVTSFERNSKERSTVHGPTRCLYSMVKGADGARYLQLDTVGSGDRAIVDKVSQSLQFDRQAASQLLKLFEEAFPGLSPDESGKDDERSEPEEEDSAEEGRAFFRLHRMIERNPQLIKRKKKSILETGNKLVCEACAFCFSDTYGPLGNGFAECHHKSPLASLDGVRRTRLSDLAIVCANCHRMLHRPPYHSVEELRELVLIHTADR